MKATNLNPLFIDQVPNFTDIIEPTAKTKEQFLKDLKRKFSPTAPNVRFFYIATERSEFDTIRLEDNSILFNH